MKLSKHNANIVYRKRRNIPGLRWRELPIRLPDPDLQNTFGLIKFKWLAISALSCVSVQVSRATKKNKKQKEYKINEQHKGRY